MLMVGTKIIDVITKKSGVIVNEYKGEGRYEVKFDFDKHISFVPTIDVEEVK